MLLGPEREVGPAPDPVPPLQMKPWRGPGASKSSGISPYRGGWNPLKFLGGTGVLAGIQRVSPEGAWPGDVSAWRTMEELSRRSSIPEGSLVLEDMEVHGESLGPEDTEGLHGRSSVPDDS